MGEIKFEKESREWRMFQDYWRLCQRYWEPETENVWWEDFIADISRFANKYGNESFPRALVMALSDEVERRYRQQHSGR